MLDYIKYMIEKSLFGRAYFSQLVWSRLINFVYYGDVYKAKLKGRSGVVWLDVTAKISKERKVRMVHV